MKARIKSTGQLVNVYLSDFDVENDVVYYKEVADSKCLYREDDLDFEDTIDWEQRRYEVIKDVSMSLLGNERFISDYFLNNDDESLRSKCKSIVDCGVMIGDYIIEELKNK